MRTVGIAVRRTVTVLLTGTLLVAVAGTSASAAEHGGKGGKTHASQGKDGAHGANGDCGAYCSTRDGSPSRNGNGDGKAAGRPCAGCVGKADDKNPPGQAPDGSDSNNGYECDGNSGIGRSNPAHTGCTTTTVTQPEAPVAAPTVEVAPVTEAAPAVPAQVLGERIERATEAAPDAVVPAAHVAPEVLGTRFTRPAGTTAVRGGLPFTGGAMTAELLLAAIALLGIGFVATRVGAARQRG